MTNQSTPPQAVGSSDGLGLLVKRLREYTTMKAETALMREAADQLEAARAVGILQEQVIMDHEREIARMKLELMTAIENAECWKTLAEVSQRLANSASRTQELATRLRDANDQLSRA